jgi:hypothetical protein
VVSEVVKLSVLKCIVLNMTSIILQDQRFYSNFYKARPVTRRNDNEGIVS